MCQGANKAYLAAELDGLVVCPDCIWLWTKSLSIRSAVLSDSQQSEVRAIMERALIPSCARYPSFREYVKEHVHNHAVSEQELVQAIQRLNLPYMKCGATTAVSQLFRAGTLELREGLCCWKDPVVSGSMMKARKGYFP